MLGGDSTRGGETTISCSSSASSRANSRLHAFVSGEPDLFLSGT